MSPDKSYLSALSETLPARISQSLSVLVTSDDSKDLMDTVIRFVVGGPSLEASSEEEWSEKQCCLQKKLHSLTGSTSNNRVKRPLDPDPADGSPSNGTKRPKLDDQPITSSEPSLFTINSISVTSPIRKKVNINVTKSYISFIHPTTKNVEATIPRSSLKRCFIVPTRAKSKPHWTVILLPSDVPDTSKNASSDKQQIIFGVDAFAPPNFSYINAKGDVKTLNKGDETKSGLLDFVSSTEIPLFEPSIKALKSACNGIGISAAKDGIPGVEGYRAAKPGTLWFMEEGLLWGESKPCEFWAVGDLFGRNDALRMISATGRTCSVYITRRRADFIALEDEDEEEEEEEEEMGDETELGMVDAKEQEQIAKWVRVHCHLFGKTKADSMMKDQNVKQAAPSGPMTIKSLHLHSDEEDEDFSDSSSDSSGSGGNASDGDDGRGAREDEGSAEETDGGSGDEDAEGEEEKLDPSNHPLLRPGAMPKKISKAAIHMVAGMVEEDIVMGGPELPHEIDELED